MNGNFVPHLSILCAVRRKCGFDSTQNIVLERLDWRHCRAAPVFPGAQHGDFAWVTGCSQQVVDAQPGL